MLALFTSPFTLAAQPAYEAPHLERDVMVPMRDGVRLATDIYRPTRNGRPVSEPLPVILHRTPYNKSRGEKPAEDAALFAPHGYVVVFQYCRGRYRSEGTFTASASTSRAATSPRST